MKSLSLGSAAKNIESLESLINTMKGMATVSVDKGSLGFIKAMTASLKQLSLAGKGDIGGLKDKLTGIADAFRSFGKADASGSMSADQVKELAYNIDVFSRLASSMSNVSKTLGSSIKKGSIAKQANDMKDEATGASVTIMKSARELGTAAKMFWTTLMFNNISSDNPTKSAFTLAVGSGDTYSEMLRTMGEAIGAMSKFSGTVDTKNISSLTDTIKGIFTEIKEVGNISEAGSALQNLGSLVDKLRSVSTTADAKAEGKATVLSKLITDVMSVEGSVGTINTVSESLERLAAASLQLSQGAKGLDMTGIKQLKALANVLKPASDEPIVASASPELMETLTAKMDEVKEATVVAQKLSENMDAMMKAMPKAVARPKAAPRKAKVPAEDLTDANNEIMRQRAVRAELLSLENKYSKTKTDGARSILKDDIEALRADFKTIEQMQEQFGDRYTKNKKKTSFELMDEKHMREMARIKAFAEEEAKKAQEAPAVPETVGDVKKVADVNKEISRQAEIRAEIIKLSNQKIKASSDEARADLDKDITSYKAKIKTVEQMKEEFGDAYDKSAKSATYEQKLDSFTKDLERKEVADQVAQKMKAVNQARAEMASALKEYNDITNDMASKETLMGKAKTDEERAKIAEYIAAQKEKAEAAKKLYEVRADELGIDSTIESSNAAKQELDRQLAAIKEKSNASKDAVNHLNEIKKLETDIAAYQKIVDKAPADEQERMQAMIDGMREKAALLEEEVNKRVEAGEISEEGLNDARSGVETLREKVRLQAIIAEETQRERDLNKDISDVTKRTKQAMKIKGWGVHEGMTAEDTKAIAYEQIDRALEKNTANLDKASGAYRRYAEAAAEAKKEVGEVIDLERNKQVAQANEQVSSFQNSLKSFVRRYVISFVVQGLREGVKFANDFANALNEIRIVTGKSAGEVNMLGVSYARLGQEMRVSTLEISKSAVALYRQGLGDTQVMERLRSSTQFAKVAGISVNEAIDTVTVAMNTGLVKTSQRAADVLVALGDAAATGADEISQAIQRSASVAKEAGVDYEHLATWIALVSEKTRLSADVIGTAMQGILSRMHMIREKGYDEDGMSITSIQKALEKMNAQIGTNVSLFQDDGRTWTKGQDVMEGIAGAWNKMDDALKAYVTTAFAQSRQQDKFIALMDSMATSADGASRYQELLNVAMDSTGQTSQKYSIYLESNAAAQERMTAATQGLVAAMGTSGVMREFYNVFGFIVGVLERGTSATRGVIVGLGAITLAIMKLNAVTAAANAGDKITGFWSMFTGANVGLWKVSAVIAGITAAAAFVSWLGGLSKKVDSTEVASKIASINERMDQRNQRYDETIAKIEKLGKELDNNSITQDEYNSSIESAVSWSDSLTKALQNENGEWKYKADLVAAAKKAQDEYNEGARAELYVGSQQYLSSDNKGLSDAVRGVKDINDAINHVEKPVPVASSLLALAFRASQQAKQEAEAKQIKEAYDDSWGITLVAAKSKLQSEILALKPHFMNIINGTAQGLAVSQDIKDTVFARVLSQAMGLNSQEEIMQLILDEATQFSKDAASGDMNRIGEIVTNQLVDSLFSDAGIAAKIKEKLSSREDGSDMSSKIINAYGEQVKMFGTSSVNSRLSDALKSYNNSESDTLLEGFVNTSDVVRKELLGIKDASEIMSKVDLSFFEGKVSDEMLSSLGSLITLYRNGKISAVQFKEAMSTVGDEKVFIKNAETISAMVDTATRNVDNMYKLAAEHSSK